MNFILYMALVHFTNKLVDLVLTVSMVTSLNKVCGHLAESTLWRTKLQWPEEVVSLLEMLANSVDLMDEIFYADDSKLAQLLLDDGVVCDGDTLFVDLAVATLVDQLSHTLQIWVSK